ncbi:MarR family winged helix-turn-helix transcriptional regulator [Bacillus mycoides]|uniref:MarR family winged helix-turn-helix transcriptional regulator n=1 Tax=Bacillus mycoides TaxID=1405 RepID=UPI001C00A8CF|nr:MarR family transcriptional regulator [Bacillus mycoides]MCQ6535604.1 MarR family transcriptional regulator [Bacillus mycoides]QWI57529.1 MarR family transcriptional regulator [Bacillus mycoides]QWI89055.1 MarR family transcriptional regulator [Bacillus mycoides]
MKENPLHLDNQLCFSIYACSREVTRFYRPYLEKMGITYPQYITLLVLWEQDGLTVKEIGERLFLDSGTLTPMLKRMESLKLVQRVRSKEDERKVCIELTKQGKDLKGIACSLPTTMATNLGITEQEYHSLLIQLNTLIETMKKINDRKGE